MCYDCRVRDSLAITMTMTIFKSFLLPGPGPVEGTQARPSDRQQGPGHYRQPRDGSRPPGPGGRGPEQTHNSWLPRWGQGTWAGRHQANDTEESRNLEEVSRGLCADGGWALDQGRPLRGSTAGGILPRTTQPVRCASTCYTSFSAVQDSAEVDSALFDL